jgi:ABC-type sugar transport system substrate-binding protein
MSPTTTTVKSLLIVLSIVGIICHASAPDTSTFNFAIMPKSIGNSFFFPVREGCQTRAAAIEDYQVSCEWVGPVDEDPTGQAQANVLREIAAAHIDGTHLTNGIAISVMNGPSMVDPIQEALQAGISVICFDSDSVESERQAYVGTDNVAFGVQLAKVLEQLQPTGGQFAMLAIPGPNLQQRVAGLRQQVAESGVWQEMPDSLTYQEGTLDDAMEQIAQLKRDNPNLKAIVPTYGGPMNEAQMWTTFVAEHRDMTFVVADAMPHQVRLMEQGFADGLVGQLPYQSGEQCIDTLLELQLNGNPPRDRNNDMVFGTNLSFLLRIPLVLPNLEVDYNYLGLVRILGYVLLAIVGVSTVALMAWVIKKRQTRIVAAGQPIFLSTILAGLLILAMAILPLGAGDDKTDDQEALNAACMAVPWLVTLGFGIAFSALFSKLWRVHRLIRSSMRFSKVQVKIQDVLWPLSVLTLINVALLISWTVVAPLEYSRQWHDGTDPWNRHISSYGICKAAPGTNALPVQIVLIVINFSALLVANVQAFRTRRIKSVLSESKYIAITVASVMQAFLVGLPVLLLVDEEPTARYVVSVLLIFCICMAVIGFIFVPKVLAERGGGNGGLDARDSNFGTSLRDSMRDSKAFQRTNSVSLDRTSSNAAVNDTVAQIRQAAMECSKTLKSYDDVEKSMSNGDGNTDEKGIQPVEVGKDN